MEKLKYYLEERINTTSMSTSQNSLRPVGRSSAKRTSQKLKPTNPLPKPCLSEAVAVGRIGSNVYPTIFEGQSLTAQVENLRGEFRNIRLEFGAIRKEIQRVVTEIEKLVAVIDKQSKINSRSLKKRSDEPDLQDRQSQSNHLVMRKIIYN